LKKGAKGSKEEDQVGEPITQDESELPFNNTRGGTLEKGKKPLRIPQARIRPMAEDFGMERKRRISGSSVSGIGAVKGRREGESL